MSYWMQLLNKLNSSSDMDHIFRDVLEDLCGYFGYGVGFIYGADYKGTFHLRKSYEVYKHELPQVIEMSTLFSQEDEENITNATVIAFHGGVPVTPRNSMLSAAFDAKSMIMTAVCNEEGELIALVGIMDRRSAPRQPDFDSDIDFAGAILTILANYVKMQMYQERILLTKQSLDNILNHMGVDVYVNDFETHEILYLNESMARPYGSVDNMIGQICWKALYDDKTCECDFCPKPQLIDADGNPTKIYGWDYKRPFDGSWFRVLSAAFPWVDGRMAQVISSIDITENKTNEELIRHAAEYDMLTTLPNRFRLTNDIDNLIRNANDATDIGAVLFFDLDGFKAVNDNLGHHVGDELLSQIGRFLQENELTHDRSYRYGGDEFVIIWDSSCPGTLEDVVNHLRTRFSSTWRLSSHEVSCGASFGISHYPEDGVLASHLLRNADKAMYASKSMGTGTVHKYNCGCPTLCSEPGTMY